LKNLTTVKYEIMIPFPIEKVINALLPSYETEIHDPNVTKLEQIKYINNEELRKNYKMKNTRSSIVTEVNLKFPFPLTGNRKHYAVISCQYDSEKKILYQILKPCLHAKDKNLKFFKTQKGVFYEGKSQKKENSKFVYIFVYLFNAYQKLDENRTLFTQIIMSDMNISQNNNFFVKLVVGKRGNEMRKEFINHIISKKDNFDKNKYINDVNVKQILELEIEKQDEEYEKLFEKKVDKKESFQIEMQQVNEMNFDIYHENGDFIIELIDFKSIKNDEFEFILYNICLLNDKNSFLKISKEDKFDIDIKFKKNESISLLHLCAKSNSLDIFQILLEMGILYFNL
jgi:hypothetical protein